MRAVVRRPVFLAAVLMALFILLGIWPHSGDPDALAYSAADGRHLLVTGTVTGREMTSNGYRLFLDHLVFQETSSSGVLHHAVSQLNAALIDADRLQVFLSDGREEEEPLYGESVEEDDWASWAGSSESADQTDLFLSVRIGDRVTFYGKCQQPEKAVNPGQFDSRRYYLARRIVLKMSQVSLKGMTRPKGTLLRKLYLGYRNLISQMRIGMQEGLLSVFGQEDAALIAAFAIGDSSGLDSSQKKLLRDGGLSWLVCVSSLHISLLGMMLYRLLRSRGISFLFSSVLSYLMVGSYALLTGFSLSAQRALVTYAFWLGSQIFGRTRDTLSSLSGAACVILGRQPYALWDSSFLISMICILSLEYLTPAVSRILRPRISWQRRICASVSLWTGSLPAVLWFFYQMTPFASLLYPVLLTLMSILLGFGLAGCMGGGLCLLTGSAAALAAGRACAWPCSFLLKGLRMLCSLEQALPGSVVILGRPALWQLIVYYAVLIVCAVWVPRMSPEVFRRKGPEGRVSLLKRVNRPVMWAVGAFIVLVLLICCRPRVHFRYTCLDIGQGSCNLIEQDGCVYLFDAGSSSVKDVWEYRIDSTLKYYGIREIDAVFLSHGDMDHVNGIEQMLKNYHRNLAGKNASDVTLRRILIPELQDPDDRLDSILKTASAYGIETGSVREQSQLTRNDLQMKVLSPSPDRITGDANQDCIVMMLSCQDLRILFTGDLEKEGEEMFVRAWRGSREFPEEEKKSTQGTMILVAGHHGSKNATSSELLEMVKPDLALISCGKNNRYGHPARNMLERLEQAGVPYRRTDLEGAIVVTY